MSVSALLKLVTPPSVPSLPGGLDWARVESELGLRLPVDYKEYVRTYGTGTIGGQILPYIPFCDRLDLLEEAPSILNAYASLMAGEDENSAFSYEYKPDEPSPDQDAFPWVTLDWPLYPLFPSDG